ncbi:hypothetical protein MTR_4g088630 [Medicago truncatula]|uniref:Uncharacterized protein n=1 Tax=Medicago truncatula TaxID=3880 RepID=A0A072UMM7_MEDTR|nr:hypothetical protein MTR_4g088630 [Medicago truncatula]
METGDSCNISFSMSKEESKQPETRGVSVNTHIETRFHFLKDRVNGEKLELEYCMTELQVADLLTKPLKSSTF